MVKHVNSGWRIYYFEVFQKAISVMSICNVKWTARKMSLFVFGGCVYFWAPSEHNRQFPRYPLPEIDTKNDSFVVQTDICYVIFRAFFWFPYVCMQCTVSGMMGTRKNMTYLQASWVIDQSRSGWMKENSCRLVEIKWIISNFLWPFYQLSNGRFSKCVKERRRRIKKTFISNSNETFLNGSKVVRKNEIVIRWFVYEFW